MIVSSDRDYYQLFPKRSFSGHQDKKDLLLAILVKEKYGMSGINFCTARCFIGDPSDGLPGGVKGAGFKTMVKRFPELRTDEEFVSVNDILKMSMEKSQGSKLKLFQEINQNHDIAKRNWRLMFLDIRNLSADTYQKN